MKYARLIDQHAPPTEGSKAAAERIFLKQQQEARELQMKQIMDAKLKKEENGEEYGEETESPSPDKHWGSDIEY